MDICMDCLKDKYLIRYAKEKNNIGECCVCKKKGLVVNFQDDNFKKLFKAVFRYHYAEINYNSHWGSLDDWIDFLGIDNEIFEFKCNEEDFNPKLYEEIDSIETHITDYHNDVSIYFGGERMAAYMMSIKEDIFQSEIKQIEYKLENTNGFQCYHQLKELIEKLEHRICKKIEQTKFYRARIGCKYVLKDLQDPVFIKDTELSIPYKDEEITAPKPKLSKEGRFNKKNVSFLYLASNINTAIAEVKPNNGQYISVGEFDIYKYKDRLKIADFYNIDFYDYYKSDTEIDEYIIMNSIRHILSKPQPNEDYIMTQFIAETLISMKYDGMIFKSSVSEGYNLVLFNPLVATYVKDSYKSIKIENIKYTYKNLNCKYNSECEYINVETGEEIDEYILEDNF